MDFLNRNIPDYNKPHWPGNSILSKLETIGWVIESAGKKVLDNGFTQLLSTLTPAVRWRHSLLNRLPYWHFESNLISILREPLFIWRNTLAYSMKSPETDDNNKLNYFYSASVLRRVSTCLRDRRSTPPYREGLGLIPAAGITRQAGLQLHNSSENEYQLI